MEVWKGTHCGFSLGSGVPAGPQRHHSQSAAGTGAVEDQHAQMGARGPTQIHHMTGPSEKFLGPDLWVKGTIALCVRSFSTDLLVVKAKLISTSLNTCTVSVCLTALWRSTNNWYSFLLLHFSLLLSSNHSVFQVRAFKLSFPVLNYL